jgi:AraC-like DNA-binding protein
VLEKAGPIRIGESGYLLEPGEAVLIFPHQFHHYMDVENGPMEWLFVTFEVGNTEAIECLRDAPRRLGPEEMTLLAAIVREHVTPETGGRPNTLFISYHLSRLLFGMARCEPIPAERQNVHSGDRARDLVLEKINRYIGSHLTEAPTIATLAEALGYSASHIRTVFRNQLGVSLGRYIRESRLSEAAKRLQFGDTSISEIAQQCGFDSHHAFSRAFKNAYGLPPKAYGKRLREAPASL